MSQTNCGKCNGKGFLPEYRAISGGKCFACMGKGLLDSDKVHETYGIAARLLNNGEMVSPLFWVKAKTPELALKKARTTLQKGTAMDPQSAEIIGTAREYAASLN